MPRKEEDSLSQDFTGMGESQYFNAKDKNYSEVEKLYVRSGNSSIDLPMKDIGLYVQSRVDQLYFTVREFHYGSWKHSASTPLFTPSRRW